MTHGLTLAKFVGAEVSFLTATMMWSAMEMTGHVQHGELHAIEEYEAKSAKWANKILAACKEQADKAEVKATTIHVVTRTRTRRLWTRPRSGDVT